MEVAYRIRFTMIKLGSNNIGKIYFGSNLIGKAYFGSNLVYSSGSGPGPGPEPQPVGNAYIRGGADGSYIDTGITADNTVKVIVWARNWLPYSEGLFGSRTSADADEFVISAISGAGVDRARIRFGTSNSAYVDNAITEVYSHYHKYEYSEGVFKVDDVVKATASVQTFNNNLNIHLFGINTGGTHGSMNFPVDVFACQIYKNNVLVRDLAAVNSPSIGMFDSVSNTLFTNAGSGSFTYGSFDQSVYTPLEYIECTAQQYFDTGLYGNQNTKVVTKFRPTGTTKTFYRVFGCRADNETLMLELMIGNTSYSNRYYYARYNDSNTTVYNSASQTNNDLVYVHDANVFTLYKNNAQLATKTLTAATFTTTYTMCVGSSHESDGSGSYPFYGYIYYIGFGSDKSFVPAKVNNVAGMYDTYNDVFYPSTSGTAFVAGPEL